MHYIKNHIKCKIKRVVLPKRNHMKHYLPTKTTIKNIFTPIN